MAARGMPIDGFEIEAAMVPPIKACAVAVTTYQYTASHQFDSNMIL